MRNYICRLSISILVYSLLDLVPLTSPKFYQNVAGYVLTFTYISENVVVFMAIYNYLKTEALCMSI